MKCLVDGNDCDNGDELCPTCKRFFAERYKGREKECEEMLEFFRKHPFKLLKRKPK